LSGLAEFLEANTGSVGAVYGFYAGLVYGAALCVLGKGVGEGAPGELLDYLGRVFRVEEDDRERAVRAAGLVFAELGGVGGEACRERIAGLEERYYGVVREALHRLAVRELSHMRGSRRKSVGDILGVVAEMAENGSAKRLTPRGSIAVGEEALHKAVYDKLYRGSYGGFAYPVLSPWRRLEVDGMISDSFNAMMAAGVLIPAKSLGYYLVPAPFLEEGFREEFGTIWDTY
jgi:hypothetical protein